MYVQRQFPGNDDSDKYVGLRCDMMLLDNMMWS